MSRKRILFVCGKNRWRSPTAEQIFAGREDFEVLSAGVASDADTPVDGELLGWADIIVVMEPRHAAVIRRRFGAVLGSRRIVCLDIPDRYRFMDPALVALLERRMRRVLV